MDQAKLEKLDCEFLMNTPASSHMGGVWERQIRTIRSVLTSILDQSSKQLDSSSLRTFLYEVMAVINSRPLTTDQLCDPSNPEPLTPNHILTMKSTIISPPPGRFVREDLYLRKRWRRVQLLANTFWTRWKKEYLLNLQGRQKWTKEHRNAKVGDLVLLKDEINSTQPVEIGEDCWSLPWKGWNSEEGEIVNGWSKPGRRRKTYFQTRSSGKAHSEDSRSDGGRRRFSISLCLKCSSYPLIHKLFINHSW